MSNQQWFYTDSEKQQKGPVSLAQLQQFAASGIITGDSLVWSEEMSDWSPARSVDGIFNQSPSPRSGSNPYASPATSAAPAATSGDYPVPDVRKSSYGLFLGTFILGIVLGIAGFAIMVATIVPTIIEMAEEMESSRPPASATAEEISQWELEQGQIMEERMEELILADPPVGAILTTFAGGVVILIAFVLGLTALFRAWKLLQPGQARTTPGQAVGFLFIPIFNLYWIFVAFYGWARDWNRIRESHPQFAPVPAASPGLFLTALIVALSLIIGFFIPFLNLLLIVAVPVLLLIMFAQIYRVVNHLAATR